MQRSTRSRGASHQSTTPTPHCDYGFFSDARPLKSIIVRSDSEDQPGSRRAILLVIGGVGDQMETRCVTQKDACNTSTCQAGEASRSRGSRNEWQQRSKQRANKTRRRRGLNVMNYFMCPVSECGISMEIPMRILYFLHKFCIRIHFVHNYESRCRSRFGCKFRIPTKFIWLLGEGRQRPDSPRRRTLRG